MYAESQKEATFADLMVFQETAEYTSKKRNYKSYPKATGTLLEKIIFDFSLLSLYM